MKRILIIEDSASIRLEIRDSMKNYPNYQITEAGDGNEGYAILSSPTAEFDLVILDFHMPHMNGIDMLRKLALENKKVKCPIIMVTTEFEEKGSELKSLNIMAWVLKPIKKARLENLIVQIFDYVEAGKQNHRQRLLMNDNLTNRAWSSSRKEFEFP